MNFRLLTTILITISLCGSVIPETTFDNTADTTSHDPLGDACQLTADEIAEIIGWKDYMPAQTNSMNSEKIQGCDYPTNTSGSLTVLFQRYDDSNPEGKYLERSFQRDLEKDSDKITYQEVDLGSGDQAIYSFGKNGPNQVYKLRWRYGNHTSNSISLRASKKRNAEKTLEQFEEIANLLNK